MTDHEKSALIGYYRMGAEWKWIANTLGISTTYAILVVKEYLKKKGEM